MWRLTTIVESLMKDYPYLCQSELANKDKMIYVRLYDEVSDINWWLAEYNPIHKVAWCYVTWSVEDEWWSVSLERLEDQEIYLLIKTGIEGKQNYLESHYRVAIDNDFKPTKFPDLPFNKESSK